MLLIHGRSTHDRKVKRKGHVKRENYSKFFYVNFLYLLFWHFCSVFKVS